MVIGNPFTFSIVIDVVEEWNDDRTFNNGLLFICIDGDQYLPQVANITLNVEVLPLIEKLSNPIENDGIFQMEKQEAFNCLYYLRYPDDIDEVDSDDRYSITPWEFEDKNSFIFMVCSGEKVRILASSGLNYIQETSSHDLSDIYISEIIIPRRELELVVDKLKLFYESII